MRRPLLSWAALVASASLVAVPFRTDWKVKAPPLTGAVDWPFLPMVAVALVVGLGLAVRLPGWCARLSWRRMLVVVALVALGWGSALALVRGPSGLDRGLDGPFEYPAVVDQVDRIGVDRFAETFTDPEVLRSYPVHVEGHPLGAALLFVGLDRIGLGGAAAAAAFLVLAGATTAPAVLLAVREVAGERQARRAAPFLVLGPLAIWMVSSADALYAAVGAWAVALLVLATGARTPVRRLGLAVAGGLVFGLGIHLSYGLAPLVLVPVAVVVVRRRWSVLAGAALGGAAVVGAAAAAGFWWLDGLAATHVRYLAGVAPSRPFAYFAPLGNPAAFAVTVGPVVAVALVRVRDRRLWLLAGAALAAVVVADVTGLSKGEVERIWLPFAPWLLVLAAGLSASTDEPAAAWWTGAVSLLGLQVVVAVLAESVVKTLW
ncbi:hypothetical protein BH10ACT1_BH10ACT1_23160 [soil metagenome]